MFAAWEEKLQKLKKIQTKLVMYVLQVWKLFRLHPYRPSNVISMDESAVWADMLSETTVDPHSHVTLWTLWEKKPCKK